MSGVNFNNDFNSNNFPKGLNSNNNSTFKGLSNNTGNFSPKIGNELEGDVLELSGTNNTRRAKSGGRGISYGEASNYQWKIRGGVENYNGKGADEMGFSVAVSTFVHWLYRKIKG